MQRIDAIKAVKVLEGMKNALNNDLAYGGLIKYERRRKAKEISALIIGIAAISSIWEIG